VKLFRSSEDGRSSAHTLSTLRLQLIGVLRLFDIALQLDATAATEISSEGIAALMTRAVINSMLTRTAAIAWPRRPFCCRIDVCFSRLGPECLPSRRSADPVLQ